MRPLGLVLNQVRLLKMTRGVGSRSARRTAGWPRTRRAARFLTAKPAAKRPRTKRGTAMTTVARRREQARQAASPKKGTFRGATGRRVSCRPHPTNARHPNRHSWPPRGDQTRQQHDPPQRGVEIELTLHCRVQSIRRAQPPRKTRSSPIAPGSHHCHPRSTSDNRRCCPQRRRTPATSTQTRDARREWVLTAPRPYIVGVVITNRLSALLTGDVRSESEKSSAH